MDFNAIFISFLTCIAKIPSNQCEKIVKCFKLTKVKKNAILLRQGEICDSFYFVVNGCIRTYYLTQDGNEKTRYIAFNESFVSSLASFISQTPSFEFVESLENSNLFVIKHKDFYQLLNQVPEWERFYLKFLESAYVLQNKKIEYLVTYPAKERYELFRNSHPFYIDKISNKILASYLNISQETLSRLKSK